MWTNIGFDGLLLMLLSDNMSVVLSSFEIHSTFANKSSDAAVKSHKS